MVVPNLLEHNYEVLFNAKYLQILFHEFDRFRWSLIYCKTLFYIWAIPGLLNGLFSVFSYKHYNFYNRCEKITIQYPLLGLNPRPFGRESPTKTTRPGLTPVCKTFFMLSLHCSRKDEANLFDGKTLHKRK